MDAGIAPVKLLEPRVGKQLTIVCYAGMDVAELQALVKESFQSTDDIVGFYDRNLAIFYPLSTLAVDPSQFSRNDSLMLVHEFNEKASQAHSTNNTIRLNNNIMYEHDYDTEEEDDDDEDDNDDDDSITETTEMAITIFRILDLRRDNMLDILEIEAYFEKAFEELCAEIGHPKYSPTHIAESISRTIFGDDYPITRNTNIDVDNFTTWYLHSGNREIRDYVTSIIELLSASDINVGELVDTELSMGMLSGSRSSRNESTRSHSQNDLWSQPVPLSQTLLQGAQKGSDFVSIDDPEIYENIQSGYANAGSKMFQYSSPAKSIESTGQESTASAKLTLVESIVEARYLMGIQGLDLQSIFSILQSRMSGIASLKRLKKEHFLNFMKLLGSFVELEAKNGDLESSYDSYYDKGAESVKFLALLFHTMQEDSISIYDFASMMTVLCIGNLRENLLTVFESLDEDEVGFVADMALYDHLRVVFRLLYHLSGDARMKIDTVGTVEEFALFVYEKSIEKLDRGPEGSGLLSFDDFADICTAVVSKGFSGLCGRQELEKLGIAGLSVKENSVTSRKGNRNASSEVHVFSEDNEKDNDTHEKNDIKHSHKHDRHAKDGRANGGSSAASASSVTVKGKSMSRHSSYEVSDPDFEADNEMHETVSKGLRKKSQAKKVYKKGKSVSANDILFNRSTAGYSESEVEPDLSTSYTPNRGKKGAGDVSVDADGASSLGKPGDNGTTVAVKGNKRPVSSTDDHNDSQYDADNDVGAMSFNDVSSDEFRKSEYSKKPAGFAEARQLLGLTNLSAEYVLGFFAEQADECGNVTQSQYLIGMQRIIGKHYANLGADSKSTLDYLVNMIYALVDKDSFGYCDVKDLGAVLCVFCGRCVQSKVTALSTLIRRFYVPKSMDDEQEAEVPSDSIPAERVTAALLVMLEVVEYIDKKYFFPSKAEDLSLDITLKIWNALDLEVYKDPWISHGDFERQLSEALKKLFQDDLNPADGDLTQTKNEKKPPSSLSDRRNISLEVLVEDSSGPTPEPTDGSASLGLDTNCEFDDTLDSDGLLVDLIGAQRILKMKHYNAKELINTISDYAIDGFISKEAFTDAMLLVARLGKGMERSDDFISPSGYDTDVDDEDECAVETLADTVYCTFDPSQSNKVSLAFMICGLISLTNSSVEARVKAVFEQLDSNSDGSLSKTEATTFILANFLVVLSCSDAARQTLTTASVSALELAEFFTAECLNVFNSMTLEDVDSFSEGMLVQLAGRCLRLVSRHHGRRASL